MLQCYVREPCSVASTVEDPFNDPKVNKTDVGSSPGNKAEVKSVSLI